MLNNRIIPVLLLRRKGLVKTKNFKKPVYVGDPINAVKIFNQKEVDELIFLDIDASKIGYEPNLDLLKNIASECFMPLAYGGGIKSVNNAEDIISIGIEKIIVNTSIIKDPELIKELSNTFGSQSIVVSIDIKKTFFGNYTIFSHAFKKNQNHDLLDYIKMVQDYGAGEIFINSVDLDGTMNGYDKRLLELVLSKIKVPLVFCGGASDINDIVNTSKINKFIGLAAGSIFVFKGPHRAVLINYPSQSELNKIAETT